MIITRPDDAGEERGSAERFQLLRRIADDLAHELKNPLNAMVINLEVLRARVRAGGTEGALERIDVLEQETRRLHQLLDHTLRFLRPDPGAATGFAVDELVAEVGTIARVLAKLGRKRFELQPLGDAVMVHARREPLRFALLALSEAAIDAAPPDDSEGVSLGGRAEADQVELVLVAPGECAKRLKGALDFTARVLAAEPVAVDAELELAGCRVRLRLPRALRP